MPNIALELGKQAADFGVKSAYGEQQEINGVSVIPVAISWSGFGGGSDDTGNGGGGGGGAAIPIGAYVGRGGEMRFEPNPIALLAVSVPFLIAMGFAIGRWGRAMSRVIRAVGK